MGQKPTRAPLRPSSAKCQYPIFPESLTCSGSRTLSLIEPDEGKLLRPAPSLTSLAQLPFGIANSRYRAAPNVLADSGVRSAFIAHIKNILLQPKAENPLDWTFNQESGVRIPAGSQ